MSKHLQIFTNGKPLDLGNDMSLDLSFDNPMFNDAQSFSYPISIPLDGNRHFIKNIEDKRSSLRPVSFEDTKAKIFTDGIPFFVGKIKTSDEEEVSDSISFSVDGDKDFKSLINNLECKDIPVKDNICIGEKVTKVTANCKGNMTASVKVGFRELGYDRLDFDLKNITGSAEFTPPALGFSVPYKCTNNITDYATAASSIATGVDDYTQVTPNKIESYINVSTPYPYKYYCNSRVAYKHYDIETDGSTSSSLMDNPYMVLDADRPQSGICFYVIYFLDCLFAYLGLDWDNSALTKIDDFNRLCFFTTKCTYDEVYGETIRGIGANPFDDVNTWLKSRGCGASLSISAESNDQSQSIRIPANTTFKANSFEGYLLDTTTFTTDSLSSDNTMSVRIFITKKLIVDSQGKNKWIDYNKEETVTAYKVQPYIKEEWDDMSVEYVDTEYGYMYANSDNFPDASVSTIISSLENQFGIRFIYDAERKKVTATLLRDMYRNNSTPKPFLGQVVSMNKLSEKVTGVRACYSNESDSKEQKNNLSGKVRDYDTNYDYIDYPDPAKTKAKGLSVACTTVFDKTYSQFCLKTANTDNTCYIDAYTGNAYRIKVDSEANDVKSMKPEWFEVGQFKGVEFGDCSDDNEDFVIELSSDFVPLILSDTNGRNVRNAAGTAAANLITNKPCLAPFCDEDMEHEYVPQYLDYPLDFTAGSATVRAKMNLRENYDTSKSDDGNSPLQSYDWDLAITIMRGGGSDAQIQTYNSDYDGFGNDKWRTMAGAYAVASDSIDHLGNEYDYNSGDSDGIGSGERFSLKPRAYKTPDWLGKEYTDAQGATHTYTVSQLCRADYHDSEGWHYIRTRGWVDRFLYEHADFILKRRKFLIQCLCSAAFVADIPNHWKEKWLINGEVGFINKVSTQISAKDGIGITEIEFYAI